MQQLAAFLALKQLHCGGETESCDAKTTRGVLPNQEDATRFQWGACAGDGLAMPTDV